MPPNEPHGPSSALPSFTFGCSPFVKREREGRLRTRDAAQAAYEQSVALTAEAKRSAIGAFNRAADAHRLAAEVARSLGDQARASQHLELARADDLSAEALASTHN